MKEARLAAPPSPAQKWRRDTQAFIDTFAGLTGYRPTSATPDGVPLAFRKKPVPSPAELLRRLGPRMSRRTANALRRHIAGTVDRGPWTYGRLLEIRGLGLVCLVEIIDLLAERGTNTSALRPDAAEVTGRRRSTS